MQLEVQRRETQGQWPALPLESWRPTRDTLHMWTQIVGKIRLALAPPVNHWWHVTLYLTSRGLTTSLMPYGETTLEIEFDLHAHELAIALGDGRRATLPLEPRSVADFYRALLSTLRQLGVEVRIWPVPVEIPDPIPFEQDTIHAAYEPFWARRFWEVLARAGGSL